MEEAIVAIGFVSLGKRKSRHHVRTLRLRRGVGLGRHLRFDQLSIRLSGRRRIRGLRCGLILFRIEIFRRECLGIAERGFGNLVDAVVVGFDDCLDLDDGRGDDVLGGEREVLLKVFPDVLRRALERISERRANICAQAPADLFRHPFDELGLGQRADEQFSLAEQMMFEGAAGQCPMDMQTALSGASSAEVAIRLVFAQSKLLG